MHKVIFMRLCSACLLGIKCMYDGRGAPNEKVIELAKREVLIPICSEQLGGLSTPREPSETMDDGFKVIDKKAKVVTKSGKDVTDNFVKGASETLKIAKLFGIKQAILKQKSPSCGCGQIYDGAFSGTIVKGDGVTAALLKRNGIKVLSEDGV